MYDERDSDFEIRREALDQAIRSGDIDQSPAGVVARAEVYEKFLRGDGK